MQLEVDVERVEEKETRSGNRRYVLHASDGREFTTFRPAIGNEAKRFEGRRARIEFHEEERGGFTNVYLDKIEPTAAADEHTDTDVEEAAWHTAIEAAPWLLGPEGKRKVEPREMFDKLKPFQEMVADDIRDGEDDSES